MPEFVTLNCGSCGVPFTMESRHHARVIESGAAFYCPAGHSHSYKETELRKAREALQAMTADRDYYARRLSLSRDECQRLARRVYALRGVITRLKRERGNNGAARK